MYIYIYIHIYYLITFRVSRQSLHLYFDVAFSERPLFSVLKFLYFPVDKIQFSKFISKFHSSSNR